MENRCEKCEFLDMIMSGTMKQMMKSTYTSARKKMK